MIFILHQIQVIRCPEIHNVLRRVYCDVIYPDNIKCHHVAQPCRIESLGWVLMMPILTLVLLDNDTY